MGGRSTLYCKREISTASIKRTVVTRVNTVGLIFEVLLVTTVGLKQVCAARMFNTANSKSFLLLVTTAWFKGKLSDACSYHILKWVSHFEDKLFVLRIDVTKTCQNLAKCSVSHIVEDLSRGGVLLILDGWLVEEYRVLRDSARCSASSIHRSLSWIVQDISHKFGGEADELLKDMQYELGGRYIILGVAWYKGKLLKGKFCFIKGDDYILTSGEALAL
ncbi:hypothetical protein Tco_0588408 [Tanacetum coccineum]